jgi:alkylation response protein AidB-like acyl-CoA dehydrogenase
MDFAFSQEQQAFRGEVRQSIKEELPAGWRWQRYGFDFYSHYDEVGSFARAMARKLGAKGWLSLTWPEEYGGRGASPIFQLILAEELEHHRCPGMDIFGVGMIAPTLIHFASDEQNREHLPGISKGEIFWCECLSEPGAGSDLASLKTQATEDNDCFVINGQKVWTSAAHEADWCIVLARTSQEPPKHKGLSLFLVDMKTPGITVRPIVNMAGDHEFNEVFFDGVRVPKRNVVGGENKGWYVIMGLLNFERASAVPLYAVALRYIEDLLQYARQAKSPRPVLRHRLSELVIQCEIARQLTYRVAWMQEKGMPFDTEAATVKLFSAELSQRLSALGMEVLGLHGSLSEGSKWTPLDGRPSWYYLRSIGNTLEMGTSEIDRDIIAARGLGLPRR